MSIVFDTNQTPATGAQAMSRLITLLTVSAGWSVTASGDGVGTFSLSTNIFTGFGSGALGLANTNAWFVLQAPAVGGVNRQLLVQRGTTNLLWRVTYSYSSHFTGGSPSATVAPTAADGQNIRNNNSTSQLFNTDGTYRWNAIADNASPYGFVASGFPSGGGNANHAFSMLPVITPDTNDVDPYVFYATRSVATAFSSSDLDSLSGWLRKGFTDQRWYDDPGVGTPGLKTLTYRQATGNVLIIPGGLSANPHSGNDDTFAIPVGIRSISAPTMGYKGIISPTLLRYNGQTRAAGDTLDVGGTKTRMAVSQHCNIAWDTSTPTV